MSLSRAADARVELAHGAGGRASAELISGLFARHFANEWLLRGDDGAALPGLAPGDRLVLATDSHVVSPLFFPGGDIGCLAVHGTLNDVAMMGARPLWLAAAFILEEGFLLADLERIVISMARAAQESGAPIVTGDTKVVERGKGDGVFITTTGAGALAAEKNIGGAAARVGDVLLVSGTIGDHGMTILNARQGLDTLSAGMDFASAVVSDTAALWPLVEALGAANVEIHVLRDPTRGGLGATLNEIAAQSRAGLRLEERDIPVSPAVAASCEFLGLDPLYLANEGKLLLLCPEADAPRALEVMRGHPLGRNAAAIGRVVEDARGFVEMRTRTGGRRLIDWLAGDPLPRIC
ncbi:MAG: hydrogenase expression/formation protein HypE [Zoogloeaceae bacterium]|jgi:hydrogenase expression/formation protein HypE|nr:hydrogenase expression/formation protein HypE [Zoogloeaceae bacterium]